jgi:branched-chain amino acid transport system ATP-binding protein
VKTPALLRVEDLEAGYGDLVAVRQVSLEVRAGEAVALIGGNGAGKTTTLRAISGLLTPRRGVVELEGQRLDGLGSAEIVARGIAHVPEGRQLFPTMTVRENLELGAVSRQARGRRAQSLEAIVALFPVLGERAAQAAGTLSGGEQQMCAIGRGLMACPRLLMLDEPSLGLSPVLVTLIFETLARINQDGTALLIVEQNVPRALRLSHRGYVLENGVITQDGTREHLFRNPQVKAAYLGL